MSLPIRARIFSSRTTTNTQGWRFSALGAWVAASSSRSTTSSGTSSAVKVRQARWRWTTSKNSGTDAAEGVDVHDAEGGVVGPGVPGRRSHAAPEALGNQAGHGEEARLGVGRVHLVEVEEAGIAAGGVLVDRDHRRSRVGG